VLLNAVLCVAVRFHIAHVLELQVSHVFLCNKLVIL